MESRLDIRLNTLTFKAEPEPHIVIRREVCRTCESHACTVVCPARLYLWEHDQLVHNCEGCLECGSCRSICPNGAIAWRYPRGGYGVRFCWG